MKHMGDGALTQTMVDSVCTCVVQVVTPVLFIIRAFYVCLFL